MLVLLLDEKTSPAAAAAPMRPPRMCRTCPRVEPCFPHPCQQMQSGFALLEAGTVRAKNTKNIRECRLANAA